MSQELHPTPSRIPEDLLDQLLDRSKPAPYPPPVDVVLIATTMFDEEDPWHVVANTSAHESTRERAISREQFDALKRVCTVVEGLVHFPRTDRYGRPDEATPSGLLEWIELEQGFVTCGTERFRGYFEDTGDDSWAECFLRIWLPKGAFRRIFPIPSDSD